MSGAKDLICPVAHRGLHDSTRNIIENTESSVRAAIEAGYGIEVDIQPARGGAPVVFHDRRLHLLTEGEGAAEEYSVKEIKGFAMRGTSDRIMELDELLEVVGGRAPLLLEIKSDWRGKAAFEMAVAHSITNYNGPIGFMSYDPVCVAAIGRHVPHIPRGLVAGSLRGRRSVPIPGFLKRWMLRNLLSSVVARPDFIAYSIDALPHTAPIIANRLFGLPLFTWTVRTEAQKAKAEHWADAMIFEGFRPKIKIHGFKPQSL